MKALEGCGARYCHRQRRLYHEDCIGNTAEKTRILPFTLRFVIHKERHNNFSAAVKLNILMMLFPNARFNVAWYQVEHVGC